MMGGNDYKNGLGWNDIVLVVSFFVDFSYKIYIYIKFESVLS